MKTILLYLITVLLLSNCNTNNTDAISNKEVVIDSTVIKPFIITEKTPIDTDDPAIWINRINPSKSLILGTDKGDLNGGIYVFDLEGKIISSLTVYPLQRPNNIDIEYGFHYNDQIIDIAVFTERGRNMIRVFRIPDMIPIDNGGIEVFVGDSLRDPMGIGLFKDPTNGLVYAIVGRKTGPENGYLWQYLLQTDTFGIVNATLVRKFGQFTGGKEIESIVVDDELGHVYYSNETVGVRQYYASPDKGDNELSLFATHLVTEDHEGISIYKTGHGTGYILLSDQQSNRFHIFQREGSLENPYYHALRKIVTVEAVESDGSDITEVPLNENFKQGLFVAMSTDQTFHYYRWEDIAGKDLLISK